MRLRREVSRRRRKLFGSAAMDARLAATQARRNLAGTLAEHGQCSGGPVQDHEFSETIAVAWIGGTVLFALPEAGGGYARPGFAAMHRNFQARTPRAPQRTECFTQSGELNSSAAVAEI